MAGVGKKITMGGTASGIGIVNNPSLVLTLSLTANSNASSGIATTDGTFTTQTTKLLEARNNIAQGQAACPRKVQLYGSCLITSTNNDPADEF